MLGDSVILNIVKMKAVFLCISVLLTLSACSGSSSSGGDNGDSITVTHFQTFDFSEAELGTFEDVDGDIFGAKLADEEIYRFLLTEGVEIKDMGKVSLDSVTEEPDSFDEAPIDAIVGHVYYLKLADGVAVIKVTKTEPHETEMAAITFTYTFTE